jgi:G3E family GTPase
VAAGLNPRADLVVAEHGQVARESLFGRIRFDARETLGAAQWLRSLNALAPVRARAPGDAVRNLGSDTKEGSFADRFGLRSVVFQARRPLRGDAFRRLVTSGLPGVVRAKGYYWLAEQPDEMGFLSVAGDQVRFDTLNYWWAALVESGRVGLDDRPALVRELWQEPWGDRRQEMVFIGVGLEEDAVRSALEACLVTPDVRNEGAT